MNTKTIPAALQVMADIARDQGMHPDEINRVCDSYADLLAACEALLLIAEYRSEGHITSKAKSDLIRMDELFPVSFKQLHAALRNARLIGTAKKPV